LVTIFATLRGVTSRSAPEQRHERGLDLIEPPVWASHDDSSFDEIATLLAHICNESMCVIAIKDSGRFRIIGQVGTNLEAMNDDDPLILRIQAGDGRLVISDTIHDPSLASSATLVATATNCAAGVSLIDADGSPIGVMYTLGATECRFDEMQAAAIDVLAKQVLAQVRLRRLIAEQAALLSQLDQSNYELLARSTRDPLTGLVNRHALMDILRRAIELNDGTTLGLLFLDLDQFKSVNDDYGHHVGDAVLIAVGQRVRSVVRGSDCVARLGGDEFVVACADTDAETLEALEQRIQTALSGPIVHGEVSMRITASIGAALRTDGSASADDLLLRADRAMYQSKRERRRQRGLTSPPSP
jgi:diguanylate cyclase (GGDEF)-like protein